MRPSAESARSDPFGTIIVVGGGCYGSYYVRQLGRGAAAGAIRWNRLVVVDRDPACAVARDPVLSQARGLEVVVPEWEEFFAGYLGGAADSAADAGTDAIVPSPLMPHLLFDWIAGRMRGRWPGRGVRVVPIEAPLGVPWQRLSESGDTRYVSFAEWMCPINCIEPAKCPVTRGPRTWTMPAAVAAYVATERESGHRIGGPHVLQCVHRAYGVGMIDVREVLAAEAGIAGDAASGGGRYLVGTVSHCHGALGMLAIDD